MDITDNNDVTAQNIDSETLKKKTSVRQLERELKKLEIQQAKAKEKLKKQIEKEKEKALKARARKNRNHQIYKIGALVPMVFGTSEFDRLIATDSTFIVRIAGVLENLRSAYSNQSSATAKNVLESSYSRGINVLEKNKSKQSIEQDEDNE